MKTSVKVTVSIIREIDTDDFETSTISDVIDELQSSELALEWLTAALEDAEFDEFSINVAH